MPHRERITITIRKDLLRGLDRTIDHQRIRNRSHALEVFLSKILSKETRQAVILASGQGVNMRPFTYEIPKPLIPVKGRPLLEYTIDLLRQHEITDVIITTSHLGSKIQDHFGDGSRFGVAIKYAKEKTPTGTGGALLASRTHLGDGPFLMLYADVLLDLDLTEFLQTHYNNKAAVGTIGLTSVADPSAYGAVRLRGTRVVEFSEKPTISAGVSRLIFAGLAAFNQSMFDFFPANRRRLLSLEQDVFPEMIDQGRLYGYPFEGQWFDVSTPETYEQVLKQWQG